MKNVYDLIGVFTKNNLNSEQASDLITQSTRIARDKNDGNQGAIDTYIDELYDIAESFYSATSDGFYKKNEMITEIIKQINKMYEENPNILTQNRESIIKFIKSIIENYNEINSEEGYNCVLNSIIAFIGCENTERIYTLDSKDKKVINQLLENKTNNLETLNIIIESIVIIADSAPEEIVQIMGTMLQAGIQKDALTPTVLLDALDKMCEIIDNQSEKDLLGEFYNTVTGDFKIYENNKDNCTVEEFFAHIIVNAKDILEFMQEQKNIAQKEEKGPVEQVSKQTQNKFDIPKLIKDLYERIKHLPKGAKRIAPVALALLVAAGARTVTHHTAPVQAEVGTEQENETEEQETEETYFQDDTYDYENEENDYTEESVVAEIPDNLYSLPIRIDTRTNANWGTHRTKRRY